MPEPRSEDDDDPPHPSPSTHFYFAGRWEPKPESVKPPGPKYDKNSYDKEKRAADLIRRLESMPPPIHPLAEDLSPPISTIEFQAFVASVRRRNGLIEPVTLYQGKVLDGLIRVDACVFLEITPTYVDLPEGEDPVQFLRDKNLKRRHLTVGQRALVAAQLATARRGGVQDHSVNSRIEDEALASGISAKSVSDARRLLACGDHGLREKVFHGTMTLHKAVSQLDREMKRNTSIKTKDQIQELRIQRLLELATKGPPDLKAFNRYLGRLMKGRGKKPTIADQRLDLLMALRIRQLREARMSVQEGIGGTDFPND